MINFWEILNSLQNLQSGLYHSIIKIKHTLQKLNQKPPGPVKFTRLRKMYYVITTHFREKTKEII